MITLFRLENKNGEGMFFYRNGQSKFHDDIKFDDVGLFGFTNISRFNNPSYIEFYYSEEYSLYEIIVSSVLSEKDEQVVFLEENIISKKVIMKPNLESNN